MNCDYCGNETGLHAWRVEQLEFRVNLPAVMNVVRYFCSPYCASVWLADAESAELDADMAALRESCGVKPIPKVKK